MPTEQRITLRQLTPNPLFEQWLSEWLSYAELKNSMKKVALAKALESLRRYPLVMHSGRDCSILEGFGQTICRMLDKQLEVYRSGGCAGSSTGHVTSSHRVMTEAECDRSIQEVVGKVQKVMAKNQRRVRKKKVDTVSDPIVELFNKYNDEPNKEEVIVIPEDVSKSAEVAEVRIPANSYEIILLVDTQETAG